MATAVGFSVGQVVHHKRFDYRGVIVDVDAVFSASDEWYEQVARSRPPKDKPWYRVLVHERGMETYVAERNLEADPDGGQVDHPLLGRFFDSSVDGVYRRRVN